MTVHNAPNHSLTSATPAVDGDLADPVGPVTAPLGPGSLTWKYFGDRRLLLFFGRTGILQNMHPAVGASLRQHSNFFTDPLDRLHRSIPPIMGVVYDPPQAQTGHLVRGFHTHIKGLDSQGRRYHALHPDVFWWTHVTFVEVIIALNQYFGTPLTTDQKQQLVAEGVTWWQRYGLSMQPVIDNYADFEAYWQYMLDHELESNATTDVALNVAGHDIPPPKGVPAPLWNLTRKPVTRLGVWLANGFMPERGREILGLTWTARDQRRLDALATIVRRTWPLLPAWVRYFSRAHHNMRRQ